MIMAQVVSVLDCGGRFVLRTGEIVANPKAEKFRDFEELKASGEIVLQQDTIDGIDFQYWTRRRG